LRRVQKVKKVSRSIKKFCLIQLQIIANREIRLRKDLQDCMIQREFLSQILAELSDGDPQ
jgi:hypothetical protein